LKQLDSEEFHRCGHAKAPGVDRATKAESTPGEDGIGDRPPISRANNPVGQYT
jgi:hypothetical protein